MSSSAYKYRVIQPLEKFIVNPPVRLAWRLGFGPRGDALLETIGRRTGRMRRTPICNGQEGDTFWLVVQHGRRTDYVRNIEANPHVRVRTGSRAAWRTGMACVLTTTTRTSECEAWDKTILGVNCARAPPRRWARTSLRYASTLILLSPDEGAPDTHVCAKRCSKNESNIAASAIRHSLGRSSPIGPPGSDGTP